MSRFLVFEGLDGCGKSTQIKRLVEHFAEADIQCRCIHFPTTSDSFYSDMVARFLRGEFGDVPDVPPALVALLYAGDRADANCLIQQWRRDNLCVIADRYVYSNMAFQGAKLTSETEKRRLRSWIDELEYGYFGLQQPDISLFLHVPLEFVRQQLAQKRTGADREYLQGKDDIHEKSFDLQERVEEEYLALAREREDLVLVPCTDGGNMLPSEQIHERVLASLSL